MSFDETIIHCGAPVLCGIKPANLFSLNSDLYIHEKPRLLKWQKDFSKKNRHFVSLKKEDNRILMFIFDKKLLEKVIDSEENSIYLKTKGYHPELGFSFVLAELLHKLAFYQQFPHEIGLFLGYPLQDVIGFEKNSSAYKYSGFWKVYGNLEEAEIKMRLYKTCSEKCMKWLNLGMSVPMAARKYEKSIA
ncbi:MAG: DUF3793 family protein [Treponema sp.]|nr:DUF3793 family protein [Candidatus Treponema equifaecale]